MKTLIFTTVFYICTFKITCAAEALNERLTALGQHLKRSAEAITDTNISSVVTPWQARKGTTNMFPPAMLREWPKRYATNDCRLFLETLVTLTPEPHRGGVVSNILSLPFPRFELDSDMNSFAQFSFRSNTICLCPPLLTLPYEAARTSIAHEFIHCFVHQDGEGVFGHDQPSRLIEGMTEFLNQRVCEKLGWKVGETGAYEDEVNAIALFMAFGASPELWKWFRSAHRESDWEVITQALRKRLTNVGLTSDEAFREVLLWERKNELLLKEERRLPLIMEEMKRVNGETEAFNNAFTNTVRAASLLSELRNILPALSLQNPNLPGALKELEVEFKARGYPAYLQSTILPALQKSVRLPVAERSPDPRVAERLQKTTAGKESKPRLEALLSEAIVLLKEDLDALEKRRPGLFRRIENNKREYLALKQQHEETKRTSRSLITKVRASPALQERVRDADIPRIVKARILAQ